MKVDDYMNKKGFTLIELLAVIVILAALVSITATSVTKILNDSKEDLHNTQLIALKSTVEIWGSDNLDKLPEVDNCSYLTLKDLKDDGLIDSEIIDPKTNEEIPEDLKFKISTIINKRGKIVTTYEVDPESIDGCTYVYEDELETEEPKEELDEQN